MQNLETERLLLRPLTLEDAAALNQVNCDRQVMAYIGEPQATVEQTREYLQQGPLADYEKYGYGRHACIDKENGQLIGFCGLKYLPGLGETDIGYRLLPKYWGQGLATETAKLTMDWGFEQLGLSRIVGIAMPDNAGSIRVLEKLGMAFNGHVDHLDTRCVYYVKKAD